MKKPASRTTSASKKDIRHQANPVTVAMDGVMEDMASRPASAEGKSEVEFLRAAARGTIKREAW